MSVYKAINAIQLELSRVGISKDNRNQQQGYNFRGIDDVYNALSPLLAKHGLCILPRCISRECIERVSTKGGALFYVTVEAEFDFVSAEDGSKHVVRTFGEAMDSADKATNKAMSAAYKYAAFQAFAIPTEGDNDADAGHHEVAPQKPAYQPQKVKALTKEELDEVFTAIDYATTVETLTAICAEAKKKANALQLSQIVAAYKDKEKKINAELIKGTFPGAEIL